MTTEIFQRLIENMIGFDYLMSRYIPVQFDDYGVTVWIPGQLEPTLALLGSSLPAVYPLFKTLSGRVATIISKTRSSRPLHSSYNSEQGRRIGQKSYDIVTFGGTPRKFHKLGESQAELHLHPLEPLETYSDLGSAVGPQTSGSSDRGPAP